MSSSKYINFAKTLTKELVLKFIRTILLLVNFHFVAGYYAYRRNNFLRILMLISYFFGGFILYYMIYLNYEILNEVFQEFKYTKQDFIFLYVFEISLFLFGFLTSFLYKNAPFTNPGFYKAFIGTFTLMIVYFSILDYPSIFDFINDVAINLEKADNFEKNKINNMFNKKMMN